MASGVRGGSERGRGESSPHAGRAHGATRRQRASRSSSHASAPIRRAQTRNSAAGNSGSPRTIHVAIPRRQQREVEQQQRQREQRHQALGQQPAAHRRLLGLGLAGQRVRVPAEREAREELAPQRAAGDRRPGLVRHAESGDADDHAHDDDARDEVDGELVGRPFGRIRRRPPAPSARPPNNRAGP